MGNEFSSVEALWSTFENIMGKEDEAEGAGAGKDGQNTDKSDGGVEHEDGGHVKGDS